MPSNLAKIKSLLKGTPLEGHAGTFISAGRRFRVDPMLLVAIAGAESSFGRHARDFNPFGWGPHIPFSSWDEGINTVAKGLRTGYLDQGLRTVEQISRKWAPIGASNDPTGLNHNWVKNVKHFYESAGGRPAATGGTPQVHYQDAPEFDPKDWAMEGLQHMSEGNFDVLESTKDLVERVSNQPEAQPAEEMRVVDRVTGRYEPGEVSIAPGADRPGVKTKPALMDFVAQVAGIYGKPLTITTGTNHSRMTVNGHVSDHWEGNAGDIALKGRALIRAGRAALVAALVETGWTLKKARRWANTKKGGLFNIGNHQIIFNTQIGGDHTDHLHVSAR